jgi:hypothetical protein
VVAEDPDLAHRLLLALHLDAGAGRRKAPLRRPDLAMRHRARPDLLREDWSLGTDSNRHLLIHIQAFWPTELPQGRCRLPAFALRASARQPSRMRWLAEP